MARYQRWIAAYDNHGDVIDESASAAFFEFVKSFKPTIRIHGGDCFDLRAIRRGASEEEKTEGTTADVEAGLAFMRRLDPQVFLFGNHDQRLLDAAENHHNGVIRSHCTLLLDTIHDAMPKMQTIPYNKRTGVHKLADFSFIHGYHCGVYAARQAAMTYRNCIMGHVHSPNYFKIDDLAGSEGYSSGTLARLELGYNRAHTKTLRQGHGWVYGIIANGRCHPWLATKRGNDWILPSEFSGEPK